MPTMHRSPGDVSVNEWWRRHQRPTIEPPLSAAERVCECVCVCVRAGVCEVLLGDDDGGGGDGGVCVHVYRCV